MKLIEQKWSIEDEKCAITKVKNDEGWFGRFRGRR
jgi:hypothetical protein